MRRWLLIGSVALLVICCIPLWRCALWTWDYENPSPKYPAYGKAFNPERVQRGIPIIPETWELMYSLEADMYENPEADSLKEQPVPFHDQKVVDVQDENTIVERDTYIGPHGYGYDARQYVVIECLYYLDNPDDIYCGARRGALGFEELTDISMDEAIEYLEKWELSFP